MAGFDFTAARKDGVSDGEIVNYLKASNAVGFDFDKALSDGVPATQIVDYLASQEAKSKDTNILSGVRKGAANVLEGIGATVRRAADKDTGHKIEALGNKIEPENYRSGVEDLKNGNVSASSLGRTVAEASPDILGGLISAKGAQVIGSKMGVKGKIAAALGGALYGGVRAWGNEADTAAQKTSGNPEADLTTGDQIRAGASTAAQAALSSLGLSRLMNPGRITVTGARGALEAAGQGAATLGLEAGVGMGQNLASQVAQTVGRPEGLTVDKNEVLASGVANAAGSSPFAGGRVLREGVTSARMRGFDQEASQSFASRLEQHADGDSLANAKVGGRAYKAAETDVRTDLSTALSADKDASARITQDADANRALARVTKGEHVSEKDLNSISAVVDGTANAESISMLTRELKTAQALRKLGTLNDHGFKGGISGQLERLRAINNPIGTGVTALAGASAMPLISGFAGVAPHTLAAIGGIYAGARLLDRTTGMRSPAKTFADKFGGAPQSVRAPVHVQEEEQPASFKRNTPEQIIDNGILKSVRATQKAKQKQVLTDSEDQLRGIQSDMRERASFERAGNVLDSGMAQMADRVVRQRDRAQDIAARETASAETQALRAQIKDATDLMSARRSHDTIARRGDTDQARDASNLMLSRRAMDKVMKQQAEQRGASIADRLAQTSPHVQENGGSIAGQPGFAKRAKEHLGGADAYKRLTQAPAEDNVVETTVKASRAQKKANGKANGHAEEAPAAAPKDFELPTADWAYEDAHRAAAIITKRHIEAGKNVRDEAAYKGNVARRFTGKENAYLSISKEMKGAERESFHRYLEAIQGASNRSQAKQVREHAKRAFPHHAAAIEKHLSDRVIESLWSHNE